MQVLLCTYGSISTIRSMARPHPTTSVRPSIHPIRPSLPSVHREIIPCKSAAYIIRILLYMHARGRYDAGTYIWIDPHSAVRGSAPPHHIHPPVHPSHPSLPSIHREIITCRSVCVSVCTRAHARACACAISIKRIVCICAHIDIDGTHITVCRWYVRMPTATRPVCVCVRVRVCACVRA